MHHVVHRLGFLKLSRGMAVLLLIIGIAVAAAFWVGPFRPLPAALRLHVYGTSPSPNVVFLATAPRPGYSKARFPIVLSATNYGARVATPTELSMSLPASYRLVRGLHEVEPELTPGNPLARYTISLAGTTLPPDSSFHRLMSDTLWLEPVIHDYDCVAGSDSIPEFVPPTMDAPRSLSQVPVFYSFNGMPERQTGTFIAALDTTVLVHAATATPPTFPTYVREPAAPRPLLSGLRRVGVRKSQCGEAQDPLELVSVDWETSSGGRVLVLSMNGRQRKQLFDLDGDSIIELEMMDPNNDGKFESWREARYAIPTMLLPERTPIEVVSIDSLLNNPQWLTTFDDTVTGPYRFLPDSARARRIPPVVDTAVTSVDSAGAAVPGAPPAAAGAPPAATPVAPAARIVIDSVWLRKFNNVAAGPYRYLQNPPARRAGARPAATVTRPQNRVETEAERAARARARRRNPTPLGQPVTTGGRRSP